MSKKLISVILCIAFVFNMSGISSAFAAGDENNSVSIDTPAVSETLLTEDCILDADTTIDGIVNGEDGVSIYIRAGKVSISAQSIVNCDITLENNAILEINGRVDGVVTVRSNASPDAREDWNGSLARPDNLQINTGGYVREVVFDNPAGFGHIDGTVEKVTYTENVKGEMVTWENANISKLIYRSSSNCWFSGNIDSMELYDGEVSTNRGKIASITVYENANLWIDPYSRVKFIYSLGKNRVGIGYDQETAKSAEVGTIVVDHPEGGVNNDGVIKNLIIRQGSAYNTGYIENAFLENCSDFTSYENGNVVNDYQYMIQNLYSRGTEHLSLEGFSKLDNSGAKKYGVIDISGGNSFVYDTLIEKIFFTGQSDFLELNNVLIAEAYMDAFTIDNTKILSLPDSKSVSVLNARVSSEFYKNNYDTIRDMVGYSEDDEEAYQRWLDFFVTVSDEQSRQPDSPAAVRYSEEELYSAKSITDGQTVNLEGAGKAVFTMELSEGDMIRMDYLNYLTLGMVQVENPSGIPVSALASCESSQQGSFIADISGEYRFLVSGAKFSADLTVSVIEPIQMKLSTYTAQAFTAYEEKSVQEEAISAFILQLTDETDAREIKDYILKGNTLYLMPEYSGHTMRLEAKHYSANWDGNWGYAPAAVSFTAQAGQEVEMICRRYGNYDGSYQDAEGARGYIYNADGKYVANLNTDGGWFWSDPLPDGEYAVVFIRDTAGIYKFMDYSDYTRYHFLQGRDYLVDTFYNESGTITRYENVEVPPAPKLDMPCFNADTTGYYSTSSTGVPGALIDFCLLYELDKEYADRITEVTATVKFSENCKILGVPAEDNIVTLPLDLLQRSTTFTVTTDSTNTTLLSSAVINYRIDGEERSVFIGSASVKIINLSIVAPQATGRDSVAVHGYAAPDETVSIYDGEYRMAEVRAGHDGYYATKVPLSVEYQTYHELKAVLQDGTSSETVKIENASYIPDVENFVFSYYVHGHADRIKISGKDWGLKKWRYSYWPGSVYTFEVKLSNLEYIDRMWVVSTTDGSHNAIEGFYDKKSNAFIASGKFSSDENYVPEGFIVEFTLKDDELSRISSEMDKLNDNLSSFSVPELTMEEFAELPLAEGAKVEVLQESTNGNNEAEAKLQLDILGDGQYKVDADILVKDTVLQKSEEDLLQEGYIKYEAEGGVISYIKSELNPETLELAISVLQTTEDTRTGSKGAFRNMSLIKVDNQPDSAEARESLVKVSSDTMVNILTDILQEGAGADIINQMFPKLDKATMDQLKKNLPGNTENSYPIKGKVKFDTNMGNLLGTLGTAAGAYAEWYNMVNVKINGLEKDLQNSIQLNEDKIARLVAASSNFDNPECVAVVQAWIGDCNNAIASCYEMINYIESQKILFSLKADANFLVNSIVGLVTLPIAGTASLGGAVIGAQYGFIKGLFETNGKDWGSMGYATAEGAIEGTFWASNLINYITNLLLDSCGSLDSMFDTLETTVNLSAGNDLQRLSMNEQLYSKKLAGLKCKKDDDDDDPPIENGSPDEPSVDMDPSGYVYEAVTSNRLEGVTAKCYYRGDKMETTMFAAEEYNQINPQITDSEGRYQWFVPRGLWKVTYEKEGYEPKETEWMEVPPPRLEVNEPLTSLRNAQVTKACVLSEYAEVEFDKYLDVDTVEGLLSIKGITGRIEPVNAEASGLSDGRTFANSFRLVYEGQTAEPGQEYTLTVAATAKCYAGVDNTPYSAEYICLPTVRSIEADMPEYIESDQEITIPVKVDADGGFDKLTLTAYTDREDLSKIVSIGEIDEKGMALITLQSSKAGMTELRLSVTDTMVEVALPVIIARNTDKGLIAIATGTEERDLQALLWLLLALAGGMAVAGVFLTVFIVRRKRARIQ